MAISEEDLAIWEQGKPYVRSILAFVLLVRFGGIRGTTADQGIQFAYNVADLFLAQLEKDLKK